MSSRLEFSADGSATLGFRDKPTHMAGLGISLVVPPCISSASVLYVVLWEHLLSGDSSALGSYTK